MSTLKEMLELRLERDAFEEQSTERGVRLDALKEENIHLEHDNEVWRLANDSLKEELATGK